MTGGLLQIITSGKQDIYLTIDPEITFFKKVYKKYVNFSCELKEILPEQIPLYDSTISFILNNKGDLLHRCYLEIELPNLIFSDKYIQNETYFNTKKLNINNLTNSYNYWTNLYDNLKNFVDIEIKLYRRLKQYLDTENITINILKDEVYQFNYYNKENKNLYKNNIQDNIFDKIDISGYIININLLITNDIIFDNNVYISRNIIINQLDFKLNNMISYLDFFHYKKTLFFNKINDLNNEYQIKFNYSKFLGHNFFNSFSLEVGANEIEKYSNDYLHINQLHKIQNYELDNYYDMIGHNPKLYEFNNNNKESTKILLPLIFWFCKDPGNSLPLISLQNQTITIKTKINDIKKIISFTNYEIMFNKLINIDVDYIDYISINNNLFYNNYKININNKFISYNCLFINFELLKLNFNLLNDNDINYLLYNFGTKYTKNELINIYNYNSNYNYKDIEYIINQNQWIHLMNNINMLNINIKQNIDSYYQYIDFNIYYSMINNPNIKLIGEFIYFDENERIKFANSKLEYIIETIDEKIFNININNNNNNSNNILFNCEIDFNKPCKELYWYIQPEIFIDGVINNGENLNLLYDIKKYFSNDIIIKQNIEFNSYNLLFDNIINYSDFNYFLSYKYLNNCLLQGINYYSFSLYPELTQPSGTINLTEIKSKYYYVHINKLFINEYINSVLNPNKKNLILKFISKSYNLLIIDNSVCKLMFNL